MIPHDAGPLLQLLFALIVIGGSLWLMRRERADRTLPKVPDAPPPPGWDAVNTVSMFAGALAIGALLLTLDRGWGRDGFLMAAVLGIPAVAAKIVLVWARRRRP